MFRRTLLLALAVSSLGAALLAWRYLHVGVALETVAEAVAPRVLPPTPPASERLARIDARLRLPPDRRALAAIAEVRRLVRGGAPPEAEAVYASGSWKITHDGELLGMLSAYPRFSALLALLDERAARERAKPDARQIVQDPEVRPELQDLLTRFDDAAAFEALTRVDEIWREGGARAGDLLAASEALAQLCALLPRGSDAADRLAARAFASLALARQYSPERTLRAEVTLAFATGYATHARELAERLPREEPLAAFVRADLDALERASRPVDAGHVDFLYGTRLAPRRGAEAWLAWHKELSRPRALRVAAVGSALDQRSPEIGNFVPELYAAVLLSRFKVPIVPSERSEWVLTQCDALSERLEAQAHGLSGPFADAALFREVYRAACLAAIQRKLEFYLDAVKQPEAALTLARSLPQSASPDLEALRDWVELLAGDRARLRDSAEIARVLANPALTATARQRLARRALAAIAPRDPARAVIADAAAAWLDSRASARMFAGDLARDVYRDPGLEEKLYATAVDLYGDEHARLAIQVASLRRDWLALWAMVDSNLLRFDERMAALAALEEQKPLEADRLRRSYESLLQEAPDSVRLRRQLARYLEKRMDNRRAARNALMPILTGHDAHSAAADSVAVTISRLYLEDRDASAAWSIVEPRLERASVASPATRAQIALGDVARAEQLAREAHARKPESLEAAADLAAVLWEAKRNAEAAELIAKQPKSASDNERCWHFCRAFVRTFKGEPAADAEAAFAALVAARLDYPLLQGTIDLFRDTAEPETAFALANRIDYPEALLQVHTESYKTLKRIKGQKEALAWLAAELPRERLGEAAPIFYFREADELLWKLVDDPASQGGSATWLLRAAAFAREREPDPMHREALVAYFSVHLDTPDEQLGAALVGLVDPEALLESAQSEAELARAAYFLGARAEGARDYHAALRFYQLALASPQRSEGRDRAHEAVTRIDRRDVGLDALARERPPLPVVAAGR